MFFLSWTNRFYYCVNAHFLSRSPASLSYFRWENLHTLWFIYMLGIQCHIIYLFSNGSETKLPNWDPIATVFLTRRDQYDEMYCVLIIMCCILLLDSFNTLYFTPFTELETGKILYDLTVINQDHYRASLQPNALHTLSSLILVLGKPRSPLLDWRKFSKTKLPHMIHLSVGTRLKLAHLQTLVESFITLVHYYLLSFYILFVIEYYKPATQPYHNDPYFWTLRIPLIIFDFTDIFVVYFYVARIFCIIFCLPVFVSQLYITHLSKLYRHLLGLVRRIHRPKLVQLSVTSQLLVRHFLRQHIITCYQVLCINRQLIARMMLNYVSISIPTNIFLVTRILFKPFSQTEKSLFGFIFLCQVFSLTSLLLPIASLHKQLHCPQRLLMPIQRALLHKHLITKLKVDSLLNRLICGYKYGMTVGPLVTVTHKTLFELLIVYVGYFIFVLTHKL